MNREYKSKENLHSHDGSKGINIKTDNHQPSAPKPHQEVKLDEDEKEISETKKVENEKPVSKEKEDASIKSDVKSNYF